MLCACVVAQEAVQPHADASRATQLAGCSPDTSKLRSAGQLARQPLPSGPCSGLPRTSSVCRLSNAPGGTLRSGHAARLQLLRHSTLRCARLARLAASSAESALRLLPDRLSLARLAADCRTCARGGVPEWWAG